jgi:hypothetical protein
MSLVSPSDVRTLVPTNLTDDQLQAVIDREEAGVVRLYGAHYVDEDTTVSEELSGGYGALFLCRQVAKVVSVTEDGVLLAASAYDLWGDQGKLVRRPLGRWWGRQVEVEYVPVDDSEQRAGAIIDLVRLSVNRTAHKSENVAGEYSYQAPEWDVERATILRRIGYALP